MTNEQTNEQKAREIIGCSDRCESINKCNYKKTGINCYAYGIAMRMAEWKDEQMTFRMEMLTPDNVEKIMQKCTELLEKVMAMRTAQRDYFRTRSRESLIRSKQLETEVDRILSSNK